MAKSCVNCGGVFKNKCCLLCLIFLGILLFLIILVKIYITKILNEQEMASFNSTHGRPLKTDQDFSEIPEEVRKGAPHTLAGFDYENRPVWLIPFGRWDIKNVLLGKEENEKWMMMYADECAGRLHRSLQLRNSTQFILIVDMDQYSYGQLVSLKSTTFLLRMIKKWNHLFQNVGYGFCINMDIFSRSLSTVVVPLMGSLIERIEMAGRDKDKYIPSILKKIPASQLPPQYGGSKDYKPILVYE